MTLRGNNDVAGEHGSWRVLTAAISQLGQLSPCLESGLGVPPRHPPLLLVHAGFVTELGGVSHRGHELHLPKKKNDMYICTFLRRSDKNALIKGAYISTNCEFEGTN